MIEFTMTLDKINIPSDKQIEDAIKKALDKSAKMIEKDAKGNHRYKNKSANLRSATMSRVTGRNSIKTYIDDARADYGKFIHDGFKSWSPDKFVTKAVDKNDKKVRELIMTELDKVFNKK